MHARLLLPATFALVAPVAVVPLRRAALGATAVLVPWALVSLLALRPPTTPEETGAAVAFLRNWVADNRGYTALITGDANPVTLDDFAGSVLVPNDEMRASDGLWDFTRPVLLADGSPVPLAADSPRPMVEALGVGVMSYSLGPDVYVLDALGLGDRFTAHLELAGDGRGRPGHEKPLPPAYAAARFVEPGVELPADFLEVSSFAELNLPVTSPVIGETAADEAELATRVATARRLLECPPLRELDEAVGGPLGPGRFLANLGAAFDLADLRIPRDPAVAVETLC